MSLTEFLLARIAEDEAVARGAAAHNWDGVTRGKSWTAAYDWVWSDWDDGKRAHVADVGPMGMKMTAHIARWDPARVLAECHAKRAIVEEYRIPTLNDMDSDEDTPTPFWVLKLLALPYAGHPDYQDWARDVY